MARRDLLKLAAAAAAASLVPPAFGADPTDALVTPNEDLMQEHGLVGRVIIIYRRALELMQAKHSFDYNQVTAAARLVSQVIHAHHEPEEENVVFPLLKSQPALNSLAQVLIGQHRVARALTARIGLEIADPGKRTQVAGPMREFIEMYEPHGQFENTIIYPAFRKTAGPKRYAQYAKAWQKDERELAGTFDDYVKTLDRADQALGIRLADFTPRTPDARSSAGR